MRVRDFLKSRKYKIKFVWLDKWTFGEISFDDEEIRLNHVLMVVRVFVHEYLHAKYPEKSEDWVTLRTRAVVRKLSNKEIHHIFRRLIRLGNE